MNALATTSTGEVILVGTTGGDLSRTVEGASDLFVRRHAADGDHLWTTMFGGAGEDEGRSVALAGDAILVAGSMENIGESDAGQLALDGLVIRLAADGAETWSQTIDLETEDIANGLAVDGEGSIYVLLDTFGAIDGEIFAYAVKLDAQGEEVWTAGIAGVSNVDSVGFHEHAHGDIAVDSLGDVVVTVRVLFVHEDESILVGARVEKIAAGDGSRTWLNDLGHDDGLTVPTGIAVDAAGNAYMSGYTVAPSLGPVLGGVDAIVHKVAP